VARSCKVVDHSSRDREQILPDALEFRSRHIMWVFQCRHFFIDGSMFQFKPQDWKRIDARSITMSDISAIDIRRIDEEDTSHSELDNSNSRILRARHNKHQYGARYKHNSGFEIFGANSKYNSGFVTRADSGHRSTNVSA
jgi:hypothetical protein